MSLSQFANALFDTASQSEKDQLILAINQARAKEVDLGLAANRLNLDQALLTLALDVHTDSNGNTDFHKVAVDLEGIDRLELKRAIATSQAKSTFTISFSNYFFYFFVLGVFYFFVNQVFHIRIERYF